MEIRTFLLIAFSIFSSAHAMSPPMPDPRCNAKTFHHPILFGACGQKREGRFCEVQQINGLTSLIQRAGVGIPGPPKANFCPNHLLILDSVRSPKDPSRLTPPQMFSRKICQRRPDGNGMEWYPYANCRCKKWTETPDLNKPIDLNKPGAQVPVTIETDASGDTKLYPEYPHIREGPCHLDSSDRIEDRNVEGGRVIPRDASPDEKQRLAKRKRCLVICPKYSAPRGRLREGKWTPTTFNVTCGMYHDAALAANYGGWMVARSTDTGDLVFKDSSDPDETGRGVVIDAYQRQRREISCLPNLHLIANPQNVLARSWANWPTNFKNFIIHIARHGNPPSGLTKDRKRFVNPKSIRVYSKRSQIYWRGMDGAAYEYRPNLVGADHNGDIFGKIRILSWTHSIHGRRTFMISHGNQAGNGHGLVGEIVFHHNYGNEPYLYPLPLEGGESYLPYPNANWVGDKNLIDNGDAPRASGFARAFHMIQ